MLLNIEYVFDGGRSEFTVEIDPDAKVLKLQQEIEIKTDLHPDLQRLFHYATFLQDKDKTLSYYDVSENAHILCVEPGDSTIKFLTGQSFTTWIDPYITTEMLKGIVENEYGIKKDYQRMITKGKGMEDHRPLALYKVHPGSTVQ